MQKLSLLRRVRPVYLTVLLALTACDAPQATEVTPEPQASLLAGASLLECPSEAGASTSGRILPFGGAVDLAGNSVLVPASALLGSIVLGMEVPASPYMLVELTVNGNEHWQFRAPVTVTIDYSRCGLGLLDPVVTVFHVDPATGELLEPMGGVDNRLLNRITFETDHFSGYAIAN